MQDNALMQVVLNLTRSFSKIEWSGGGGRGDFIRSICTVLSIQMSLLKG
jgi:hypothetical protein